MSKIRSLSVVAATFLGLTIASASAHDAAKYPDWHGYWVRIGSGSFDPSKPPGLKQQVPLTPDYQKILEASVAEQAAGGQGNNPMGRCISPGMPRTMTDYDGMEIIVSAETTYIMLQEPEVQLRRIYTDGRAWPVAPRPAFLGYSIGKWLDEDGDGRFDVLEVETRAIKNPHSYNSAGAPFHIDAQTIVKERITPDKADKDIIRNEMTIIDHALTRPYTVTRGYHRTRNSKWFEVICTEDNHQVQIGKEFYYVSGTGYLMPTRKDQRPPDLKYFGQTP